MAKRSFQFGSWVATAQTDASALTSTTYQAIECGTTTQGLNIVEIEVGGQDTTTTVNVLQFVRSSTFGTTPSALATTPLASDGPLNGMTDALSVPIVTYVQAATGPQRASAGTVAKLNLTCNSFGGIVRWQAAFGEEWGIVTTVASRSGSVLSAHNVVGGGGRFGSHIIYEPF